MNNFNLPKHIVNRETEIYRISEGLKKYNSAHIEGKAATGKTILSKLYLHQNHLKYSSAHYFSALEIEFDSSKIESLRVSNKNNERIIVVIDGFDEVMAFNSKSNVIDKIHSLKKEGVSLITTSRLTHSNVIKYKTEKIRLSGLTKNETSQLINNLVPRGILNSTFDRQTGSIFDRAENNPFVIKLMAELLKNGSVSPKELLSLMDEKLSYKSPLYRKENDIITPPPQLITDIKLINTNLLEKVQRRPKLIYEMSSRQFEELVAELFEKDGHNVTLTKETRDGGKDLFIVEHRVIGNFIYYVECKKFAQDFPVGVRLVRELYGTVMADRATAGLLITSSYFSNPAKQFTEQIKSQMSLMDYSDLKSWIDKPNNNYS